MEENNSTRSIPINWLICTLDDVIVKMSNGANATQFEENIGYPISRIETIWNESIDLERVKYVKENDEDFLERYSLQNNDILLSHINSDSHLGKTGIFKNQTKVLIHGINLLLIRPSKNISADFLNYQFKHLRSKGEFIKVAQRAVNQSSINQKKLKSFRIVIPPASEQHRIVAKIEALFSELDKGIESFKTAREQLKIYRQALLKHAFSGKLTEQWRTENADAAQGGANAARGQESEAAKLESAETLLQRIQTERQQRYQQQLKDWEASSKQGSKPKAPKTLPPLTAEELAELPELPEGWAWVRLIEGCEEVVDCHNKTAPYQDSGIELVRTPSIRDMKLNFDDSIRFVSQETYEFWSRRCIPLPGDVLFTREAPMGEAAIIPEGKKVCMGQRMMLFRADNINLSSKYLLGATQTPLFKKLSEKLAVGTGVKHLRVGDVERLLIPICSIHEQMEIVSQLDSCLSEADQLDQTITTALQQAEALRQSILKKAFSGQLVPQDPNDEPASVLLERIRAEKANTDPAMAKRTTNRKATA